ncbi:unnamed protein product [Paramecium sonneborni]|uniref:Transmembrane protein n=1 Tax=Paramecium sonneborni TaxID=65129 RepID=A0A8S1KI53_9CILI|nr:unnamed protein product [Paramecium sonneborni]
MSFIEFFYHNASVAVLNQEALSYIKSDQPVGILIDMWRLIILVMNNKDTLFINSSKTFCSEIIAFDFKDKSMYDDHQNEIILNFFQVYDYSVSQSYIENQFDYNRSAYELSPIIVSENYLFVFLDNFWVVALKILKQIFIYFAYLILPWILINLNFIAFFILDYVEDKPYYYKIKESFIWFGGQNQHEKENICKQVYRFVFAMVSFLIVIILFSDFIYLIINSLAKSNFNTIQDMKDLNAIACYYEQDQFLQNLFARDRGLSRQIGVSQLQCMEMLNDQFVDVVIMSEFNLLIFLEQHKIFLSKLRYQVKLNTNIAHHILINKNDPQWFRNELNEAIDVIQKQKLDLLIKEKHLPTKIYNSKNKSIMPYQPTLQLICAILSILFIIVIQITLVLQELNILKNKLKIKSLSNKNGAKVKII